MRASRKLSEVAPGIDQSRLGEGGRDHVTALFGGGARQEWKRAKRQQFIDRANKAGAPPTSILAVPAGHTARRVGGAESDVAERVLRVPTEPVPPLEFVVPGPPVPKARARVVTRKTKSGKLSTRSFTPEKTADYERRVKLAARQAVSEYRREHGREWPTDMTEYRLTCTFYREANRGDMSNFIKAVEDGMNPPKGEVRESSRIVWPDDSHVTEFGPMRMPVDRDNPRAVVCVEVIGNCPAGRQKGEQ